ncbi:MAG TPA: adenylate/guanylate cyclase domain-containing protein [Ktedonobacterales bacterium]|nr:adenylate/guanylate cyclase domain-containing protein [Ktedonobacterales bacterium]
MQRASQRLGPQDSQQTQPDSPGNGTTDTPQQLPADQSQGGRVGGLPTTIMQPGRAAQVAQAVQSANAKAQDDVKSIAAALTNISNSLHTTTQRLERAVEGTYASDAGDPRVQLLAETLHVARAGDYSLARIGDRLRQLDQSVQSSHNNIGTLQREREMLASLYHIAQVVNSTLELESVLNRVMDKVIEVVGADRGFLMLYNKDTHRLEFTIARNKDGTSIPQHEFTISRKVVEKVWRTKDPIVTANAAEDKQLSGQVSIVMHDIRSILCAPLQLQNRSLGIVYVDNRQLVNPYTLEHLDLLAACCNQAAIAIDNAQKVREITDFKNLLDNIFRSIASGVITLDTKGHIQLVNRAAERIFMQPAADVLGQTYQHVFTRLGQEKIIDVIELARGEDNTVMNREIDCELPNRGKVTLSINISPLHEEQSNGQRPETVGMVMAVEDLTEMRTWRDAATNVKRIFQRYVHPSVVEELMNNPKAVELGGQTKEVSILFADIRGYTALSEGRRPEEVVEMLNDYLDILTEAIWREQGTLTMFQGDAIMAIFNAPLPQADHALRAVRAALGMRKAIEDRQRQQNPNLPEVKYGIKVRYGIGVNTGMATIGNIGSRDRLQNYTAIGDAVNIASRLQSNSADNEIIIHLPTYEQISWYFDCMPLDPLQVKNKKEPLIVYKVLGPKPGM